MTIRVPLLPILLCVGTAVVSGQDRQAPAARLITLRQALDLASQNNHRVRLARLAVDEKQRARDVAWSGYFPLVRIDSGFTHLTDTQLVDIPSGSLGRVGNTPIPVNPLIISQGARSSATFGTGVYSRSAPRTG
jgi:outer membrane protein TolC